MLHSILVAPFSDSARQAQFEAVRTILQEEAHGFSSVLVGNFEVSGEVVDALVVRPHSITVLLFVPAGGLLDITDQQAGAWQLGPYTLQGDEHAANPFEQFLRQQEVLAPWLGSQLTSIPVQPELVTGVVLFAGPVQFGPGVETYLRRQPGAENFQLLAELPQLPRRLRQLSSPEINVSDAALRTWQQVLTTSSEVEEGTEPSDGNYWEQKVRQLWSWLGAGDIPHDAPYGSAAEAVAASQQEKLRLEELSQQVRAELSQQRQEMEAREAERERSIEQLRTQLTQASPAPSEVATLQAQLAAETQEKHALHEAIRASQAESAARNQELDARIQQLGQLIEQLQKQPTAPSASAPTLTTLNKVPSPARSPKPVAVSSARRTENGNLFTRPSWRLQWPRALTIAVAAGALGLVAWGIVELADSLSTQKPNTTEAAASPEQGQDEPSTATVPSLSDIQPDTLTIPQEEEPPAASQPEPTVDSTEQQASTPASTEQLESEPAEQAPTDSVEASEVPAPVNP